MPLTDLWRECEAFLAEDQHRRLAVVDAPVFLARLGTEEEWLAQLGESRLEDAPRVPHYGVHPGPVVQTGTAHLLLAQKEAQGTHEVEPGAGGQAGAAGVAGVPVDLRLHQDDVEIVAHEREESTPSPRER